MCGGRGRRLQPAVRVCELLRSARPQVRRIFYRYIRLCLGGEQWRRGGRRCGNDRLLGVFFLVWCGRYGLVVFQTAIRRKGQPREENEARAKGTCACQLLFVVVVHAHFVERSCLPVCLPARLSDYGPDSARPLSMALAYPTAPSRTQHAQPAPPEDGTSIARAFVAWSQV